MGKSREKPNKRGRWFQNAFKYLFPSMNNRGLTLEIEIILKIDEKLTKF